MDARTQNTAESSIGDLFTQLVDDGRRVVSAEANLYKQIALYRVGRAKAGLILAVGGGALAFAGFVALLVGLVMGLAPLIGPVGAGLVVFAAAGLVGYLLVRAGVARLAALSGDPEEKTALLAGERKA